MSNCDCETSFQLYFETSIKAVTFHFHVVDFLHCPTSEHLPREIGVTFPEERLLRQSRATQRNLFHGSRALFPLPPSPASAVSSSPLPPSSLSFAQESAAKGSFPHGKALRVNVN